MARRAIARRPKSHGSGIILFVPAWEGIVCAPCQHNAGPRWADELGPGVRPATSNDIQDYQRCASCGADMTIVPLAQVSE